jgi:hypothetical protein
MLKTPISSSKPRKVPPNYKSYLDAIKKKNIVKITQLATPNSSEKHK